MNERRLVRIAVSFELLRDMMDENYETPGILKTVKGLPSDAVMISDGFDTLKQQAYLFFYHESFDIVPAGDVVPTKTISHGADYTHTDLLRRWREGIEIMRLRDDALLDTIINQELGEVFKDTQKYLKGAFE